MDNSETPSSIISSRISNDNLPLVYLSVSPIRRNLELGATKNELNHMSNFELKSSLGVAASDYIQLLQDDKRHHYQSEMKIIKSSIKSVSNILAVPVAMNELSI